MSAKTIVQPTAQQQIEMLKEQTRLTGALHDAQVLQLKLWPLCVFDTATDSEFTWDPLTREVTFKLSFPKKAKKPSLGWWKERVSILNKWVQALLGDEWMIHVQSGRLTFNGNRTIPAPDARAKGSAPDGA